MNATNVSLPADALPDAVLDELRQRLDQLTPELRKAAAYVLENPNEVGVSSIREIADAAEVKPGSFMRMARAVGFDGYDDFREPFREKHQARRHAVSGSGAVAAVAGQGRQAGFALCRYGRKSAIENIEQSFAATDAERLRTAADAIVAAAHVYVLGVGINHALARNFSYPWPGMAMDRVEAIPKAGSVAVDDLSRAGEGDVLIAMTFKPYRREVVEAVAVAREQGVAVIGISDSPAAPILQGSTHAFVVQSETPQFFPSTVATVALLETLMAFVIADARPEVIASIERFHDRRHDLGIYVSERRRG